MREITDHQIKLFKICDAVRWNQVQYLHRYHYHLIRRACGTGDALAWTELRLASDFATAWGNNPPPPPDDPYQRSPWMELYQIEPWRADAIQLDAVDEEELKEILRLNGENRALEQQRRAETLAASAPHGSELPQTPASAGSDGCEESEPGQGLSTAAQAAAHKPRRV